MSRKLLFYLIGVSALFVVRMGLFVWQADAGIEHDSGWYLGVARNLAMHGEYASFSNTAFDSGKVVGTGVHGRPVVQDEAGRVLFPAGVTVGPGYLFPQALVLWVFGPHFWTYCGWPLLALFLLVGMAGYYAFLLSGWRGLWIFHGWLWCVPPLYISSYEAFAEPIGALYLLSGFLMLRASWRFRYEMAGVLMALAILTKTVLALFVVGFALPWVWELWKRQSKVRQALAWLVGLGTPLLVFRLYRWASLSRFGGSEAVEAAGRDAQLTFQTGGSGWKVFEEGWSFENFQNAMTFWAEIGIDPVAGWVGFGLVATWFWREGKIQDRRVLMACAVPLLWFTLLSQGWARWVWPIYLVGLIYASAFIARGLDKKAKSLQRWLSGGVFLFVGIGSLWSPKINLSPVLTRENYQEWRQATDRPFPAMLPPVNIPHWSEQKKIVDYIEKHLPEPNQLFYQWGFMNAEISTLSGRVFYPLARVVTLNTPPERAFLIVGPYQRIPTEIPALHESAMAEIRRVCAETVVETSHYQICRVKPWRKGQRHE